MTTTMTTTTSLTCWTLGDEAWHKSSVTVTSDADLFMLQDAIKDRKKNAFEKIDPDCLILWKVTHDLGSLDLEAIEGIDDIAKIAKKLDDSMSIAADFPPEEIDKSKLHIIIVPYKPDDSLQASQALNKAYNAIWGKEGILLEKQTVKYDKDY